MRFNDKLQQLRKEKGLSQEALAEMLNVSRQAVSKWESGQAYPETDKLIALSEFFGVTLDSLLKDGEPQTTADGTHHYYAPPWLIRREYEYKSEQTVFGMPLVHINIGYGNKKAKGFVAIGNVAQGFVSIGFVSLGIVSVGLVNVGLFGFGLLTVGLLTALGVAAVGAIAIGTVAVGAVTLGAVSIGVYSLGALAVGVRVAVGDHAHAPIAVGEVAKGTYEFIVSDTSKGFSSVSGDLVRQTIRAEYPNTWNWIINWLTWFMG